MLKILIEFVVIFFFLFLIYYFFIIRKCKNNSRFVPVEVNLILMKYKIDLKKINLYSFIKVVSIITTFILSIVITIISEMFENAILSIVLASAVSILLAIIFYNIIGRIYEKKSETISK